MQTDLPQTICERQDLDRRTFDSAFQYRFHCIFHCFFGAGKPRFSAEVFQRKDSTNDVADVKAEELDVTMETHDHKSLVSQNNIFALRSGNVKLGRWSRVDLHVILPADPWTGFVQVKYSATAS